jgi:hypothetical protein
MARCLLPRSMETRLTGAVLSDTLSLPARHERGESRREGCIEWVGGIALRGVVEEGPPHPNPLLRRASGGEGVKGLSDSLPPRGASGERAGERGLFVPVNVRFRREWTAQNRIKSGKVSAFFDLPRAWEVIWRAFLTVPRVWEAIWRAFPGVPRTREVRTGAFLGVPRARQVVWRAYLGVPRTREVNSAAFWDVPRTRVYSPRAGTMSARWKRSRCFWNPRRASQRQSARWEQTSNGRLRPATETRRTPTGRTDEARRRTDRGGGGWMMEH